MRVYAALVLLLGAGLALPGTSLAGSVTLTSPPGGARYKGVSVSAKGAEVYGKLVGLQTELQVKKWDELIVANVRDYETRCSGITLATTSRVAAKKRPAMRALLRDLRANAAAKGKNAKRLNTAMRTLTDHLAADGAPAPEVAAVRTQAATAVKLLNRDIRLRKALAKQVSLRGLKLRARDLPRSLRRAPQGRAYIGKPVAGLIASAGALSAQRTLIAVLEATPIVAPG